MSVMCYQPEKFEKIGTTLVSMSSTDFQRSIERVLETFPDAYTTGIAIQDFIADLQLANLTCYCRQYDEELPEEMPELRLSRHMPLTPMELIKSLDGLSYNLTDNGGATYNKNGAYDKLEELRAALARHILRQMPAYQNAHTW